MTRPASSNDADARDATRAAADLWGATAAARVQAPMRGWLDSPMVRREYVQPRQTGSADTNWLVGLVEELGIPRSGRWLSLGCGAANTEIYAARQGCFASMRALEVSAGAIEVAVAGAAAQGVGAIEFGLVDFDRLELPAAAFDVVMTCMSLHHVARLEGLLRAVESALRPEGYFLINEFIGSSQFQFPALQVRVVRDLLAALPERLRQDVTTGKLKSEYLVQPVEHWNRWDPSESLRSAEIVPLLNRTFDVVVRRDYGGTVLNLLLEHIIHNFDYDNPDDLAFFRLLAATEDLLIRQGVLASDFTVMAMRRRSWYRRLRRLWGG